MMFEYISDSDQPENRGHIEAVMWKAKYLKLRRCIKEKYPEFLDIYDIIEKENVK